MDFIRDISFFSFALNALIFILLLALSRESLKRIRNIVDILTNGGFRSCPFYRECAEKGGKRWYDKFYDNEMEGGEKL